MRNWTEQIDTQRIVREVEELLKNEKRKGKFFVNFLNVFKKSNTSKEA